MKILKKNQLVILIIALLLLAAGYLNYTSNENLLAVSSSINNNSEWSAIGDAKLVSSNNLVENDIILDGVTNETSSNINKKSEDTYFTSSKLERDNMYSQMIENYQELLNNQNTSSEQKSVITEEIKKINEVKNIIMISENLIKTKGFENCIIFVNGDNVSVIIKKENLTTEEIAQIQNIVSREMKVEIANINITTTFTR